MFVVVGCLGKTISEEFYFQEKAGFELFPFFLYLEQIYIYISAVSMLYALRSCLIVVPISVGFLWLFSYFIQRQCWRNCRRKMLESVCRLCIGDVGKAPGVIRRAWFYITLSCFKQKGDGDEQAVLPQPRMDLTWLKYIQSSIF